LTLLRSILFQIWFWSVSAVLNIAWLPALLLPRTATVRGMELWTHACFWGLKHIAGLDYEIRGREHVTTGGAIYAIKHLSMWETMAVQVLLRDPAQILKRELTWVPFYGWYALKSRQIVVDREAGAKALRGMLKTAQERINEGRPIVIFPEGTRKPIGAAPDYKPGVAALYQTLDVPCIPVAHNSGLFWLRRGIIRKPGRIIVEFLAPIAPGLGRRAFMAELEMRIEEASRRLVAEGSRPIS
jgi:1-acyl-sn-glycerol-3-phosphate acyltransferase